jgi:hypothetical protein
MYRYFSLNAEAEHALIGAFTHRIWMVSDQTKFLPIIQQIFFSKVPLLLVNISGTNNFAPGLIDNSVCLNWKVNGSKFADYVDLALSAVPAVDQSLALDNTFSLDNTMVTATLSHDRAVDLQQQIMLLYQILNLTTAPNRQTTVEVVKKVFARNLTADSIEQELYHMAMYAPDLEDGSRITILRSIGRLYE